MRITVIISQVLVNGKPHSEIVVNDMYLESYLPIIKFHLDLVT